MPVTNPILQHLNGKQGFKKGEGSNKKNLGFLIEIHSFNDSYLPVKPSIQNSAEYSIYGKSFCYWCKRHLVKK